MTLSSPAPVFKKKDFHEHEIELTDYNNEGVTVAPGSSNHLGIGSGFKLHNRAASPVNDESERNRHGMQEISESDDSISLIEEDLDFPEGGLQAYLVVFGSFMGLVPVFGLFNAAGAIEAYVSSHQLAGVGASTVSWIFSINAFIAFSSSIFSGSFFDRNGARPPMIIGAIFFTIGLFATGNAKTVYQFVLAFGVANGFGLGMLMSPLVGVVSHYFKKKRGTATSIATTGGSIGGIVFPLMLRSLYPKVGFEWAIRTLSFICLFCFIISITFCKGRQPVEQNNEEQERLSTGSFSDKLKSFFKAYFLDTFDYKALFEAKFLFCALGVALSEASLVASLIYFPSYALKRGFSESTSYLLPTVVNTTGILGRCIPGYLADKFLGRFNVAILTLCVCTLVSLVLWLPFGYSLKILYSYSAIFGFFSGSIQSLAPVCCGQISRTDEFGKRFSTAYLVVAFASLAITPIGGAIIGDGSIHNYNSFIIFLSMLYVASFLCYGVTRYICVGFKLCKF